MDVMSATEWKDDYERLLATAGSNGDLEANGNTHERRTNPRFKLHSETIWVKVEPRFSVIDVSINGIAFYSSYHFRPDTVIQTSIGKAFSIEAKVLDCEMVESDPDFMEAMYQVRCQFVDENMGMQFLVMLKEMDNINEGVSISG